MEFVCTGQTGSLGRFLPNDVVSLKTRLEQSQDDMKAELAGLGKSVPSVFIHLAAQTSVQGCEQSPEKAFELNVNGAKKWLCAAAEVGCRRFIQVSTVHVFKPTNEPIRLDVRRPPDAVSVYGRSKMAAENELLECCRKFDIQLVIARVFSVISSAMRRGYLYPELLRRVRERDFSPLRGYKNVRDFSDARVICEKLVKLGGKDLSEQHQFFHLCSGVPMSVRELAVSVFKENGIAESEMAAMFPDNEDRANYLISYPSEI